MPWGQPMAVTCAGFQVRREGPGGGGVRGGAIAVQFLQRQCNLAPRHTGVQVCGEGTGGGGSGGAAAVPAASPRAIDSMPHDAAATFFRVQVSRSAERELAAAAVAAQPRCLALWRKHATLQAALGPACQQILASALHHPAPKFWLMRFLVVWSSASCVSA